MDFGYDEMTVNQFTRGDCWRLAWEINQSVGLPLHALCAQGSKRANKDTWGHVVTMHTAGVVDITGVHSKEAVEGRWGMRMFPLSSAVTSDWGSYTRWLVGGVSAGYRNFVHPGNRIPQEVCVEIVGSLENEFGPIRR